MTERPRRRALLALGSNLGDRAVFLREAVAAIPDVVDVSFAYETDPVGGPDQQPFLNLVVMLDTELGPYELLEVCRAREAAAERVREGGYKVDHVLALVDRQAGGAENLQKAGLTLHALFGPADFGVG